MDVCEANEYSEQFYRRYTELKDKLISLEYWTIYDYVHVLEDQFDQLLKTMSDQTFWLNLPQILGIDSKLFLLEELLSFDLDLQNQGIDLIEIIENDYRTVNHENFGRRLNEQKANSIIFCVD